MKIASRILVCLYLLVAVLPLAAMVGHAPDRAVFGAVPPAERPVLAFDAVQTEAYQKAFTAWFESTLGWKGVSVTTDNALLYHLFRDTKPGSSVAIGAHDTLYSIEDIFYYNKAERPSREAVDLLASRIASLQRLLAKHHRALVPLLIPSKTSVYRDHVTARWTRDLGQPRPSDEAIYEALVRALDAHQVRYVDARRLLTAPEVKRELVWGRQARHWTRYGACLAMREVSGLYGALTGEVQPPYTCEPVMKGLPRTAGDFDLWNLLNLWRPPKRLARGPVVEHAPPPEELRKPSLMFVGTSFCWELMYDATASQRFGATHMDYYNRTLVEWPANRHTVVEPYSAQWRSDFLDKELYVLDLLEVYLLADQSYVDQFLSQVGGELERRAW